MVYDSEIENENENNVVLLPPVSLEGTYDNPNKPPNFLQLVYRLLSNVKPGVDLFHFQLPPVLNMPKSILQCLGEVVYGVKKDMLSECANGKTAVDRMISVVAWSISGVRTCTIGSVPYNSVLGETHHVSRGTLNILLEGVSHHPPIGALHATDETNNIELIMCLRPIPKFYGAYIEALIQGKRTLNLLEKGESYVMNNPKLLIRLFPKLGCAWVGSMKIKCQETGLEAEISYKTSSLLGFRGEDGTIKGKIIESSSMITLHEIFGHWDRLVYIKDTKTGKTKVLYDPKEVISSLPSPILRDPKGLWKSDSVALWAKVSKNIINKEWDKAREAKRELEEKERELLRKRKSNKAEAWTPKHFDLSYSPENGWDCTPKQKTVPPAPIIFPI